MASDSLGGSMQTLKMHLVVSSLGLITPVVAEATVQKISEDNSHGRWASKSNLQSITSIKLFSDMVSTDWPGKPGQWRGWRFISAGTRCINQ